MELWSRPHSSGGTPCGGVEGHVSLQEYFQKHIMDPLDMNDTGFVVPPDKRDRFVALHQAKPDGRLVDITGKYPDMYNASNEASTLQNSSHGLVSTEADILKFCDCLR